MTVSFEGAYAVDASVLIDLVYDTKAGRRLRELAIADKVSLLTHEYALVELRYILCRRLGVEEAWARVEKILASGYLIVENTSSLAEDAARLKCERRISLPDCFTIALAQKYMITALFASKEAEIERERNNKPFDVKLQFLTA